jgi:hypothetical protein
LALGSFVGGAVLAYRISRHTLAAGAEFVDSIARTQSAQAGVYKEIVRAERDVAADVRKQSAARAGLLVDVVAERERAKSERVAQSGGPSWWDLEEAATVDGYTLTYLGSEWQEQPHRRSMVARFQVQSDGEELGVVEPRLNHYKSMGTPIGTPEVRTGLDEDLYLSLVNVDPVAGTASLEVLVQPLVWWLWFGGALMALGTVVAGWPSRARPAAPKGA